ncbi:hypothetical protein BEWA_013310 [Theileria equi strain WA]|uniref:Uncharacterized protein n=1 Tax=Theileria equi strain WA TaxID=1537102 RepID=L1LBI6_THEEQ|nr:hypothetical protein BEWA_013310 [Theileria equi strain WA]EKX72772.1 hypothetical protein BEWA_013310 [Theileria equi strain WA]|eukprot:XP_004832224.1 hypothetical protein BEWA_013310 [Theileria equi strain WA]
MECNEDEYIHLDLDSLFREADELGVMKTLQMMHLCSHKLELDIKSLVTSELDSVLLCVTTILEICSLIKNSRTNLDNVGALIKSFGFYDKFSSSKALDEPLDGSCLCIVSEWLKEESDGMRELKSLDIDALLAKIPDNSKLLLTSMAMDALQTTSMKNYRLLKTNKVLQSYHLLHTKSPALITIIECIGPGHVKGINEFVKDIKGSLQFHIDKLRSHCLAVLDSSDVNLVLEILFTLILLSGKAGFDLSGGQDGLESVLERRSKLYKIAIHNLQVGSFKSLESLMLQFVANYVFIAAVEAIYTKHGIKVELEEHMHADLFAVILKKHLAYYSLNELGTLYNKLLDYPLDVTISSPIEFDADAAVKEGISKLHDCILETFKMCACDKISKSILAISSTICKPVNISVESLYTNDGVNSNYSEYFSCNDLMTNDRDDTEMDLDVLFSDLYAFVDLSRNFRDEFTSLVHEKLSQLLNVISKHIRSLQIKEQSDETLMLMDEETDVATLEIAGYLFDGVVHKFLSSNKLVGLILSLGKFPEPLSSQVHDIYEHIATNLLEPIVKHTKMMISSLPLESDASQDPLDDEKKLYAVMIMYASFNIKSIVRAENSYRDSKFNNAVDKSALEMAFGLYNGFESVPTQLQMGRSEESDCVRSGIWTYINIDIFNKYGYDVCGYYITPKEDKTPRGFKTYTHKFPGAFLYLNQIKYNKSEQNGFENIKSCHTDVTVYYWSHDEDNLLPLAIRVTKTGWYWAHYYYHEYYKRDSIDSNNWTKHKDKNFYSGASDISNTFKNVVVLKLDAKNNETYGVNGEKTSTINPDVKITVSEQNNYKPGYDKYTHHLLNNESMRVLSTKLGNKHKSFKESILASQYNSASVYYATADSGREKPLILQLGNGNDFFKLDGDKWIKDPSINAGNLEEKRRNLSGAHIINISETQNRYQCSSPGCGTPINVESHQEDTHKYTRKRHYISSKFSVSSFIGSGGESQTGLSSPTNINEVNVFFYPKDDTPKPLLIHYQVSNNHKWYKKTKVANNWEEVTDETIKPTSATDHDTIKKLLTGTKSAAVLSQAAASSGLSSRSGLPPAVKKGLEIGGSVLGSLATVGTVGGLVKKFWGTIVTQLIARM